VGFRQAYCRASDAEGCLGDPVGYPGRGAGTVDYTLTIVARVITPKTPPTAVIAPPTPANPIPGTAVTLDGSGSYDNDGDSITHYQWMIQNLSGGMDTLSGPVVQYTWTSPGTYSVTLTVTDSDGQTGTATASVIVSGQCSTTSGFQISSNSCDCSQPQLGGAAGLKPITDEFRGIYNGYVYALHILPSECNYNGNTVGEVVTLMNTDCPGNFPRIARLGTIVNGVFKNEYVDVIGLKKRLTVTSCLVTSQQTLYWVNPKSNAVVPLGPPHFITVEIDITSQASTIRTCLLGVCRTTNDEPLR